MTKQIVSPEMEVAALEAARKFYLKLHPLDKPDDIRSYPPIYWFFMLITIASAALAALRTGPVFYDSAHQNVAWWVATIEALLAVIVIDLAAAGLAYLMVKERDKRGKVHNLGRVIMLTLIFCVVIQVGANLYAVAGPVILSTNEHKTAELIISILVGLAAPIVAFIASDGLSVINLQHHEQMKQQKSDYDTKLQALFESFEAWYDARKRNEWLARVQVTMPVSEPIRISRVEVPSLPSVASASVTDRQTDNGQTLVNNAPRKSNAQGLVFAYLDRHPTDANLPSRTLAERIGVGHDSANKYRNEWLARVQVSIE